MREQVIIDNTPYYTFFPDLSSLEGFEMAWEDVYGRYTTLKNTIQSNPHKKPNPKQLQDLKTLKHTLKYLSNFLQDQLPSSVQKNVVKVSQKIDQIFGHGQDSLVYDVKNGYVLKESIKEANASNLQYFQNKYRLLRTYLGEIIPKSYFIWGDSIDQLEQDRNLDKHKIKKRSSKIITLQKKIEGKTLGQMSFEEKQDPIFLEKLKQAHRRYVALKIFLQKFTFGLSPQEAIDVKMDIGGLSDLDSFPSDSLGIKRYLNSPNIIYDGENVYFIDFDFGEWNPQKQKLFDEMMDKKNREDFERFITFQK